MLQHLSEWKVRGGQICPNWYQETYAASITKEDCPTLLSKLWEETLSHKLSKAQPHGSLHHQLLLRKCSVGDSVAPIRLHLRGYFPKEKAIKNQAESQTMVLWWNTFRWKPPTHPSPSSLDSNNKSVDGNSCWGPWYRRWRVLRVFQQKCPIVMDCLRWCWFHYLRLDHSSTPEWFWLCKYCSQL